MSIARFGFGFALICGLPFITLDSIARADSVSARAVHPQGGPGEVSSVNVYVCPAEDLKDGQPACEVTVEVAPGKDGNGKECDFKLKNPSGVEFFYLDRYIGLNSQSIKWTLKKMDPDQEYTPQFRNEQNSYVNGIRFTEGGDYETKQSSNSMQVRRIKANSKLISRRTLLLYDIRVDIIYEDGRKVKCDSFGPGIINRG